MSISTRSRSKWPIVAVVAAVVGVLGFAGLLTYLLGGAGAVLDAFGRDAKTENAVDARVGQTATDGQFKFTVTGMTCGTKQVGEGSGAGQGKKAQGQYCLVDVAVTNDGSSAEAFSDLSQNGYDATGAEYAVDSTAGAYANQNFEGFLQPIEPKQTVRGRLVFDVPVGRRLTAVVLHESVFSTGVKVPLR